jgi:hypothetical protein
MAFEGAAKRVVAGVIAVLLALTASGCVGGSRSGSDQPGVGPAPGATQKESINESSEDDIAAALRRNDVDDPQGWARIVIGYRPYPPSPQGDERLRQIEMLRQLERPMALQLGLRLGLLRLPQVARWVRRDLPLRRRSRCC